MDVEQEEVKKRMQRFIASDNALRRPKTASGFIVSFTKLLFIIAIIGGSIYGIYVWHPWKTVAQTTEGENIGHCKYGYQTTRALEIFGFRVNESKSLLCRESVRIE